MAGLIDVDLVLHSSIRGVPTNRHKIFLVMMIFMFEYNIATKLWKISRTEVYRRERNENYKHLEWDSRELDTGLNLKRSGIVHVHCWFWCFQDWFLTVLDEEHYAGPKNGTSDGTHDNEVQFGGSQESSCNSQVLKSPKILPETDWNASNGSNKLQRGERYGTSPGLFNSARNQTGLKKKRRGK